MKSNKNWLLGGVAVALLLVAMSWFFLVSPKRSSTTDVKAQTTTVEASNAQLRADLATLNDEKSELTAKQAAIAAVGQQVPDDPQLAGLLRTMRRAADDSGVVITSITPGNPTAATALFSQSAGYASIQLDMVVQGTFTGLKLFLSTVQGEQRVIVPVSVQLAPNAYVAPGVTPQIIEPETMTISARTYTTDTANTTPIQLPQLQASASSAPSATPSASASK